jgi:hypothetical protein
MSRTTVLECDLSSTPKTANRLNYEEVVNHLNEEEMNDMFRAADLFGGFETDRNRISDEDDFFAELAASRLGVEPEDDEEEDEIGIERGTDKINIASISVLQSGTEKEDGNEPAFTMPAPEPERWNSDPIRLYLSQMANIPLLTKEEEVVLSKRIEKSRRAFRRCVLGTPFS